MQIISQHYYKLITLWCKVDTSSSDGDLLEITW